MDLPDESNGFGKGKDLEIKHDPHNSLAIAETDPPEAIISFHDNGNLSETLGTMFVKDGKWCFEGDMEKSAQVFIECCIETWDTEIEKIRNEARIEGILEDNEL